jgi:hypothetical protein
LLEKEAEKDEMDIDELLKYYRYASANPVWTLVEDIQKQSNIYKNILEEIKSQNLDEARLEDSVVARRIREKYEALGLIDPCLLPNPSLSDLAAYVVDKISKLGRGLLKLLMEHGKALMQELHCEQGTTAVLQVQIGWPLAFTIGVEHTVAVVR